MTATVDSSRAEAEHSGASLAAQQPPGELAGLAPNTPAQTEERGSTLFGIQAGATRPQHGQPGSDSLGRDASARSALAALDEAPRRSLAKGELLYHQGDAASTAYLVEAGLLALAIAARPGRERIVGLAGPGDLIGAHTLGQDRYLDSAGALSQDVRVARLELAAERHDALPPPLRALLSTAAYQHLERLTDQLEDAELPVPARVARTFLRLAQRFGQASGNGAIRLTLPLTHDTLAAMVGAARETTSTTIEQLRKLGLVTGTRGRYLVQPEALRSFAHQAAFA